jgi:4-hydroxybenzoate polyprenyltransferase
MLNNVSDLELDAQVGKVNELKNWSPQSKIISSLGVGTAALLFGTVILPLRSLPVLGLCFLLAWVYSLPPRFKENVILGPLVASMGQLSAPAAVILVAWGQFSIVALVYAIVVSLYGLRMILVHQLLDYENDTCTSTVTTAIVLGRVRVKRLIGAVLVLEVIGSTILLALLLKEGMPPLLLLLLLLPLFRLAIQLASGGRVRLDSYTYIPLADFHESLLPLMLAISLGLLSGGRLWWLAVLLLAVFLRRHRDRLLPPLYMLKGCFNG